MANAIEFGVAPAEGTALTWSGQEYLAEKVVPFTSRGVRTAAITWLTHCPECGIPVRFDTGLKQRWFPQRCKAHNANGEDKADRARYAKEKWVERMAAAKARKAASRELRIVRSELHDHKHLGVPVLRCTVVDEDGEREEHWREGVPLEEGDDLALDALLKAEFRRLVVQRDVFS